MMLGGFGFGWILMILFWALVIMGMIYLFKQSFSGGKMTAGTDTAEDVLKKRYAAGEISKDEYNEHLRTIRTK